MRYHGTTFDHDVKILLLFPAALLYHYTFLFELPVATRQFLGQSNGEPQMYYTTGGASLQLCTRSVCICIIAGCREWAY